MENTSHYCEMCGNSDSNGRRVVKLKHGAYAMYMCAGCVKVIVDWLEVKILFPKPDWTMSRQDLAGWIDPQGKKEKPHIDDLRNEMSEWDKDMIESGKSLMKMEITRNDYYLEMRKKVKRFLQMVGEYLEKIT